MLLSEDILIVQVILVSWEQWHDYTNYMNCSNFKEALPKTQSILLQPALNFSNRSIWSEVPNGPINSPSKQVFHHIWRCIYGIERFVIQNTLDIWIVLTIIYYSINYSNDSSLVNLKIFSPYIPQMIPMESVSQFYIVRTFKHVMYNLVLPLFTLWRMLSRLYL